MSQTTIPGSISVDGALHPLGPQTLVTLGSGPDNDIVVDHPLVAPAHLRIEWRDGQWWVVAVESSARVFTPHGPLTEQPINGSIQMHLGSPATGPAVAIALARIPTNPVVPQQGSGPRPSVDQNAFPPLPPLSQMPRSLRGAPHLQPLLHDKDGEVLALSGAITTLGRTGDNAIVVDDMMVSRKHARITSTPAGLVIEDLGSVNGTYVNGQRIARSGPLPDGAVLTVGNSDFGVAGRSLIRGQRPQAVAGGLQVRGISLVVDNNKQLLDNITFAARPGTLTAIIGPSGAGKSTVSKIAAGLNAPTSGTVTFEDRDVHIEYDALRTRIGMVPQQDVLHRKLTLRQALGYAAELRLPPDVSAADREQVIHGVLDELQLTEHLDTRVDKLSGGQQKRASVAMELLTGPSLLILDEPTSGLDPALDRQVMATLRKLADAGRVVLVVTHSVAYLSICDQVLMLAPGGKTAFAGPPDRVAPEMGTDEWAEIFATAAADPDGVHRRYLQRTRPTPPPPPRRMTPSTAPPPQASPARQTGTVARRQVRLILADRGYLAFLIVMPVVLGLLTLVIPGSAGFGVNKVPDGGEAIQILIILVIGAAFMGTALTVRDLVGERDIFERERAVGLRPGAYLSAKILVFVVVATAQAGVMIVIAYLGKGVPSGGVVGAAPIELFVAVAVVSCVSALVGLAISATVRSNEQTMPPLVVLILCQLVFSGGLFRLDTPGLEQLSWIFPSYWGYAAAAGAVELNRICAMAPQTKGATLWEPDITNALLCYSALALISLALVAFTASRLRLKR